MRTIWVFSIFSAPPEHEMRLRMTKMAEEFVAVGDKVIIFASSAIHNTDVNMIEDDSLYVTKSYSGVDFIFVKCASYNTNGSDRISSMMDYFFRLGKVLKEFDDPDVIIAESPYPTVAFSGIREAKKRKVPCIVEVVDLWPESLVVYQGYGRHHPVIVALRMLEKWFYRKSDALVFSMRGGWDYIKLQGWDRVIPEDKVFYINNGVDLEDFYSERDTCVFADEDLDDPAHFKVIYCGSIRYVNNLGPVIKAAQILQQQGENCKILLFGDGNERPELEAFCKQEGIENVAFKGFVEKKYIPSIVSRADLNLISVRETPIGRFGSSWNKMFEYLAAGKPIVSNFRNAYDIIDETGCGIITDDQSAEAIAAAILTITRLTDDERSQMGERGSAAVKEYDYSNLAAKLKKLIDSVVK